MSAAAVELQIEALLVASGAPVEIDAVRGAFPGVDVDAALAAVGAFWAGRGMVLKVERGRAWLSPSREVSEALEAAEGRRGRRLTDAAVETLAVIAFNQPVTLADVERVRGVKLSRGLMDALMDAGLVRASTRRTDSGRAVVYVTTDAFLEHYGLGALTDMPTPEEAAEMFSPPPE